MQTFSWGVWGGQGLLWSSVGQGWLAKAAVRCCSTRCFLPRASNSWTLHTPHSSRPPEVTGSTVQNQGTVSQLHA